MERVSGPRSPQLPQRTKASTCLCKYCLSSVSTCPDVDMSYVTLSC